MAQSFRFHVRQENANLRLDQSISAHLPQISRTRAKKILALGGVFVAKRRVKVAGRIPQVGQLVEVHPLADDSLAPEPGKVEAIHVPIIEETNDYLVVNKASGIFSAATKQSDQNHLLAFLGQRLRKEGKDDALFLVHRLDRPTSGLMVLARNKSAAAALSAQVEERSMRRIYLAVLAGHLEATIDVREAIQGKEALTTFVPVESRCGLTLIRAQLSTGRTHQVRLHAEFLETPVVGDSKYGRQGQRGLKHKAPRLALHACELRFLDPKTRQARLFKSPLPPALQDWWDALPSNDAGNPPDDC